jgi:hypothetical protein
MAFNLYFLCFSHLFNTPILTCRVGSSDFGTLIYFKLIWIAEKILRSNYKIPFLAII